jgi:hypothetical protein
MVNWESQADRGPCSSIRSRARGGGRQSKPRVDRDKTPQPAPEVNSAAPRGSPIANKLGRHATHVWTSIPIPHQAVQVRTPSPLPTATFHNMPASSHEARSLLPTRPPYGATVSHRRRLAPRAGSPTYWASRLAVPPSGHDASTGTTALRRSAPKHTQCSKGTESIDLIPLALVFDYPLKTLYLLPPSPMQGKMP